MKYLTHTCCVLMGVSSGFVAGCGAPADGGGEGPESEVGEITLAVVSVPAGVTCIQAAVVDRTSGTTLTTQNITSTPGSPWTANLSLGTFVQGSIRVTGLAYSVACSSITGATPTWAADPFITSLVPGVPTVATLRFRQNFPVQASGNFTPAVADFAVGVTFVVLRLADGTVKVTGTNLPQPTGLTGVAEVAAGNDHACARKNDGTVWCWGMNTSGQLGNGTTSTTMSATPVQATGVAGAVRIAASWNTSCASTATNTYCWGNNANGALGDGTTTNRTTPVSIGGPRPLLAPSQNHSCHALNGGGIRCSGLNSQGQLGNGTTGAPVATPVDVSNFLGPISLGVGSAHSCAVDSSFLLSCWGQNTQGQLGTGNVTSSSVPTSVVGIPGFVVSQVAVGSMHTCALTVDGLVYCWGQNSQGQLGANSGRASTSPLLVPFQQTITQLRSGGNVSNTTCALDIDQVIWCWGDNGFGQMNDGTFTNHFSPVKMPL